ncbi:MAG: ABC transporter permease [Candidatus Zambryskibacteria bacterium]|nr:ABC transporter permease [Candidatus Zambryskibacteria bacterium]
MKTSLSLGLFLALRQVRRSSVGTTALIIFVMMLTFLNLVVIRGVLVGLIESSVNVFREKYAGDIFISSLPRKDYIEGSTDIISIVKNLPWLEAYSPRYAESGTLEGTYKERIDFTEKANTAGGIVTGINPVLENQTTGLSSALISGRFLTPEDTDSILIGASLLKKYLNVEAPGVSLLENVDVGSRVRLKINGSVKELTIVGVLKNKGEFDRRIVMLDSSLRTLIGRSDYNVDEVAVRLKPGVDPSIVKQALVASGVDKNARIQTAGEALPQFLKDIKDTFGLLGNVIGSIGLVVASITIFIVIYVNAITRRKFIGIMKGIGIDSRAIEFSYILQSVFYAVMGVLLGLLILYGFLVPFIDAHPINFPFSNGILVAEIPNTLVRAGLLIFATIFAGYIPARLVVKGNTLDAILGR